MARWRGVGAAGGALKDVDLELRVGDVVFALGPSGAGKSTLLRLLADGVPEVAEEFEEGAIQRPVAVLEPSSLDRAEVTEEAPPEQHWRLARGPAGGRTARWKALCSAELDRQLRVGSEGQAAEQPGRRLLLLLDEVFDSLPRPLRAGFAEDLRFAAQSQGFAVVAATHCLAGDVAWIAETGDWAWILDRGCLRRLALRRPRGLAALRDYAALRCRLGTVNA